MRIFLLYSGFIVVAVSQVAWASFLLIQSIVLPLTVFYLWAIGKNLKFKHKVWMAFGGGVIIDTLGADAFGRHALALLLAIGAMELIESKMLHSRWVSRVVSLVVGSVLYVSVLRFL